MSLFTSSVIKNNNKTISKSGVNLRIKRDYIPIMNELDVARGKSASTDLPGEAYSFNLWQTSETDTDYFWTYTEYIYVLARDVHYYYENDDGETKEQDYCEWSVYSPDYASIKGTNIDMRNTGTTITNNGKTYTVVRIHLVDASWPNLVSAGRFVYYSETGDFQGIFAATSLKDNSGKYRVICDTRIENLIALYDDSTKSKVTISNSVSVTDSSYIKLGIGALPGSQGYYTDRQEFYILSADNITSVLSLGYSDGAVHGTISPTGESVVNNGSTWYLLKVTWKISEFESIYELRYYPNHYSITLPTITLACDANSYVYVCDYIDVMKVKYTA